MQRLIITTAMFFVALHIGFTFPVYAQGQGGDIFNEAPLSPIPPEMTFEEYRDMNRRFTVGLALLAIPIPGMIHFYAGEKKTGWIILGSAALGVGGIISGIASADDGNFPDSDFDLLILNSGDKDKERRFERIPIEQEGDVTTYRLREIHREPDDTGAALIVAGAAILLVDIAYDFIHGIRTIEKKRDFVRYKYGRQLRFGLNPQIDLRRKSMSMGLALNF